MLGIWITIFIMLFLALIVEISATALKLTGLNIHTARFQALSAITGTGFTTKETELIMSHRQRRWIIMALMILGPVGFIGILSSILLSIKEKMFLSQFVTVVIILFVILQLSRSKRLMAHFHRSIEKQLKKRRYPRRIQLEEVLQLSKDYGICEVKVDRQSRFIGKSLAETDFKEKGLMILAIEREEELIPVPRGINRILEDDVLVVFGNLKNIEEIVGKRAGKSE